jgi:hypothetical protein
MMESEEENPMTGRSTITDHRPTLLGLLDPIDRAARLVLLLDERQPDALRAEAISMRPERLFWTLTQLDDGLPLEVCQALVRAVRLGRGRRPVGDRAEVTSVDLASTAAVGWLRVRWPAVAAMAPLDWLGVMTVESARPLEVTACWLDGPPVVGPPPGEPPPGLRDLAWLLAAFADSVADVLRGLALR